MSFRRRSSRSRPLPWRRKHSSSSHPQPHQLLNQTVPYNTDKPSQFQCCTRPAPASSNTCTNNAGVKGTCMAAQLCRSDGGVTEAGHCPGDANIQVRSHLPHLHLSLTLTNITTFKCCTRPPAPSTSNTCTTKAGLKGTCMAVGLCRSDGGVTEAGHCPGGNDIQVGYLSFSSSPAPLSMLSHNPQSTD